MPLKKDGVKSSSKKPLKKGGVKSPPIKPAKKGGTKSSPRKPLKKGGVKYPIELTPLINPPRAELSPIIASRSSSMSSSKQQDLSSKSLQSSALTQTQTEQPRQNNINNIKLSPIKGRVPVKIKFYKELPSLNFVIQNDNIVTKYTETIQ